MNKVERYLRLILGWSPCRVITPRIRVYADVIGTQTYFTSNPSLTAGAQVPL